MDISYRHLWKAKYENVLRLAKFLKIDFSDCECDSCKTNIIEKIVTELW